MGGGGLQCLGTAFPDSCHSPRIGHRKTFGPGLDDDLLCDPQFPFWLLFALLQFFLEVLYLKHVKIQDLLVYT